MKRDYDLVRTILSNVEEAPAGKIITGFRIDGYEPAEIGEHVRLLVNEGILEGGDVKKTMRGDYLMGIRGMTWKGHDFLAASRDEKIWAHAKEKVLKAAGGVAFDVLLEWLKDQARQRLAIGH